MCLQKCPKCNQDFIHYLGDNCTGEIEDWHCQTCDAHYEVDVNIHRHFETMREVVFE